MKMKFLQFFLHRRREFKVYALSEPEALDCWNPKHARLKDLSFAGNPKLKDLVGRTHFNIRKNFIISTTAWRSCFRAMGDGLDFIEESLAPLGKTS